MKNSGIGRLIGVAFCVVLLAGCSSQEADAALAEESLAAAEQAAAEEAAAEEREAAARERQEQSAVFRECQNLTADLSEQLNEINSRLGVGMSFDAYGKALSDSRVTYDEVIRELEANGVSDTCLEDVAIPLETSLNQYTRAYQRWDSCVEDFDCDFDDGSPALTRVQRFWQSAGDKASEADTNLRRLEP